MIERIDAFLKENSIDISNKSVLLGFSGGPDSTLLLEYLLYARNKKDIKLRIMHLNHRERDEADSEEEYVKQICSKNRIECSMYSQDIYSTEASAKLGFERAAREIRLKYFLDDARQYACDYIITGHNLTDRVETMLLNMERGTGLRGLVSMRPVSGIFIKPLLFLTRGEIRNYLKQRNKTFINDITNEDQSLGRNRIRHNIIPLMEQYLKNGLNGIEQSLNTLQDAEFVLKLQMEKIISGIACFGDEISIDITGLKKHDSRTMRTLLYYILQETYMVNSSIISELEKIIISDKPNITKAFKVFGAVKEYETLRITCREQNAVKKDRVKLNSDTLYNGYIIKRSIGKCPLPFNDRTFICLPRETGDLYVRTYRHGDRFSPFGMKGTMKLKDYFINSKIPAQKRMTIPIVTDSDDNILWITGYRRSALNRVNTKKECTVVYGQKD